MPRPRIRQLLPKLWLGNWRPGPQNSITDVPGVLVHTQSIRLAGSDDRGPVNTGATVILPRKDFLRESCYAGICRFNGCGELTGSHWVEETGLLNSAITITGTFGIGAAHQGVLEYVVQEYPNENDWSLLPVIGETWDGRLSDVSRFAVKPQHIVDGIKKASDDPVPEGNTGGGTGMVCHGFKGGTGSSSRRISGSDARDRSKKEYTIGALVQANYGKPKDLRIGGAPIGRLLLGESASGKLEQLQGGSTREAKEDGSIIIVIATDAPLHPLQLQRLAKRATVGLARVGGLGHNGSGDIFLAFSTANKEALKNGLSWGGNEPTTWEPHLLQLEAIGEETINELMEGVADATEEAIYNALCAAETMEGRKGTVVKALPLDDVQRLMAKYLD